MALVVNVQAGFNRADRQRHCEAVSGRAFDFRLGAVPEQTVSALRGLRFPRPALLWSTPVNLAPEPFLDSRTGGLRWLRWALLFRQTGPAIRTTLPDASALPAVTGPGGLVPVELRDRLLDGAAVARFDRAIPVVKPGRPWRSGSSLGTARGRKAGKAPATVAAPHQGRIQVKSLFYQAVTTNVCIHA
jgi:hypothetical protein